MKFLPNMMITLYLSLILNQIVWQLKLVQGLIYPFLQLNELKTLQLPFSDGFGNSVQSFSQNSQMQIVGTISNEHDFKQKFVYVFQVKNDKNIVESLSWIQGEISSKQSLDVSQSWIPKKSGIYEIETFVWNSINDPTALSPFMSTLITIP